MSGKIKYYVESMRLRTLPLSIAGVILGSSLAIAENYTQIEIFIFTLLTTLSLQILSNISNELGDLQKGTDDENRLGPIRAAQSGKLTVKNLMKAMFIFIGLSIFFGILLVYFSFNTLFEIQPIVMLMLGLSAIIASIKYTFGKGAYGYIGLGDIFVFIFFGLVSVCGVYYLAVKQLSWAIFLPASAIGLLSTAVLNVNNMRDITNDSLHQKTTMVVRMGAKKAKQYHIFLITLAFILMIVFSIIKSANLWGYLYLISLPAFIVHVHNIIKLQGRELDSQLKTLSLSTLLFAILAGVGYILA